MYICGLAGDFLSTAPTFNTNPCCLFDDTHCHFEISSKGFNWTIKIEFSEKAPSLKTVAFHLFQVQADFEG